MTRSSEIAPIQAEPEGLPYWLVNVPRDRWPAECPDYLCNLPAKNISILSTPDSEYVRQDWDLVRQIIASNRIDLFRRVPSDLRRYLEYTSYVKSKYGSVMNFVVRERLRWENNMAPRGSRPFENPDDHKILYNDWPYGVEEGIVHLVVWTKFTFEDDPVADDLTPRARKEIDDFVDSTFRSRVPAEKVIWFRNWKSLKSVHAVEHFHVMLYRPDMEFVHEVTDGDVPLIDKGLDE
ncbi:N-acetylglucosamine-induced protein [Trichophyton interdigitale]|uniref:N-acetylglucosamine-induced protein n=1 Tax=Trichophyton interdigitale TaxID=101480 RepID=A0A9P5CXD8_9EURO|nr:N-acetylglucosamine-induced protein [Trichophyton interdigitale]KAF3892328.1 N-acetylglucosamine-induced protein [Trichophyton interdigitale]KAG8207624.1 N-acetylglucosamine-induced protein [Trichophyton interdigitale]